jgi:rhamnose utilization protein RhaD (predicted bifunctional aldolase and dehydrogenase)
MSRGPQATTSGVPQELVALSQLSAKIGSDSCLIQGPGGNTSLKDGKVLYVKASGTWLSSALVSPIFVALDRDELARHMDGEADVDLSSAVVSAPGAASGLRPSIETVLHAFMPQRVVLHVHSVNAIAHVVHADGQARVAGRLAGLAWCWAPYARPGTPLLRAAAEAAAGRRCDVLLMASHGLVVGADTVADAAALLASVEERLSLPARSAPQPDLERLGALAQTIGYRLPRDAGSHALGLDPTSLAHAQAGALYPDHVVFLGPGGMTAQSAGSLPRWLEQRRDRGVADPPAVLVPGEGVLLRADLGAAAEEMVRCLALVTARLAPGDALVTLAPEQEAELMGWDAEAYRRQFDRPAGH